MSVHFLSGVGSSLKDYVDQMIPGPDTAKEENTQGEIYSSSYLQKI